MKDVKSQSLKPRGEGSLQLFLKLDIRLLFSTTHISPDAAFLYPSVPTGVHIDRVLPLPKACSSQDESNRRQEHLMTTWPCSYPQVQLRFINGTVAERGYAKRDTESTKQTRVLFA